MRQLPWILVLVAAAASLGVWLGQRPVAIRTDAPLALTLYPQSRVLSDFSLQDADGAVINLGRLGDRYTLVFFGFTHCPDVCPTALGALRDVEQKLSPSAVQRVQVMFVSVDPERDDADTLKRYVGYFSPRFIAARGAHEQLASLTREMGAIYVRQEDAGANYNVDHSAAVFLIDPKGQLIGRFAPPLDATRIASDLNQLAGS